MAGKRAREKSTSHVLVEKNGDSPGRTSMNSVSVLPTSESQLARLRLRERWELASVLNFLHVFRPMFETKLEFSAEEIETALIMPNEALARLHILLLKGIPPVSKDLLIGPNSWIKELREKLNACWPKVAEGEFPLLLSRRKGVCEYKEIDPTVRLAILRALCEIRLIQNDILTYINGSVKEGRQVSTFRKDRIGGDGSGTSYWYDGDSVVGHRLYREVINIEYNQSSWEKGHLAPPPTGFQWETLATNLEEFREISEKISSTEVVVEPNVGKIVEKEILPVLEELQKEKEKALQQEQEKARFQSDLFRSIGYDDIGDNPGTSGKERKNHGRGNGVKQNSRKQKGFSTEVVGLRRSRRVAGIGSPGLMLGSNADMKKQLRQRPPHNSIFEPLIISDSEDTNFSEDLGNVMLGTG